MESKRPARVERRLAAIIAADVAGYSRLIGADEGTLSRLKALRAEVIDPKHRTPSARLHGRRNCLAHPSQAAPDPHERPCCRDSHLCSRSDRDSRVVDLASL